MLKNKNMKIFALIGDMEETVYDMYLRTLKLTKIMIGEIGENPNALKERALDYMEKNYVADFSAASVACLCPLVDSNFADASLVLKQFYQFRRIYNIRNTLLAR